MIIKRSNLAAELPIRARNQIFGVAFKYKDNVRNRQLGRVGVVREMTCRFKVSKGVKGIKSNKVEDTNCNVLTVYDMSNGFRRINLASVYYVRIDGKIYGIGE